ncbi:MAG: NAD(P)-dependent oxidoreductase [Lachnospiraceae bacterium]
MKRIGFIGIGIMGKAMAANLMKAGYELAVYNRTKEKAAQLIEAGAVWCDSVKECAAGRDVVITMIGAPKDVEEVYFGENGILNHAQPGTCLIDMTSSQPALAVRIYEAAKAKGLKALDAPVTGGDRGAKAGTLTILAGGDQETFEQCRPVFEAMGKTIVYEGKAGNGQHTKLCNQIAVAGAVAGVCESLAYAKRVGLDLQTVFDTISTGSAGSVQMNAQAPKIIAGNYDPGFFVRHFIKDMTLANGEALESGLTLPVLQAVLSQYQQLEKDGMGELGIQALEKGYQ